MKYQSRPEKNAQSGLTRKTNSLFTVIMTLALMTCSLLSFGQSPEVRSAFRLIDIEQTSKGISALEQQASASSQNQYYLGLAYIRTGSKDKALAAFEKGISMNEKDGLNHAGKGHLKLLEKNPTEAKLHFDKALSVSKSKDAAVLRAVAEGYLSDTKYVLDAINLLNKAKTINGADAETHIILGDAFLKQNNGGESVSSYERAGSADPKNAKPFVKIAEVYQRSKNYDMVFENLNKAITVDAQYAPAYKKLGELYYVRKEADKAVEAYEKYLAITENPGQAKFQYAFFLAMAKKFDKANEIFKEITSADDAPAIALRYYGWMLAERIDKKEDTTKASALVAEKIFARYFEKAKPEEVSATDFGYIGKVQIRLDKDSLANLSFIQSLELDSAQTDILQSHGDAYMAQQKYAEAADAFKQLMSLRKAPLSQDLWSIGRAYYFSEQFQSADTAFAKLAEKQPTVTHGWLWSAKSRAQIDSTGQEGLAIPMYEKFIEIAAQSPDKYKKDLIDAYDYMGQYALHKKDNVLEAKGYFEKILALDPTNDRATEFMNVLKQAEKQQKGR
jgi:tetratricopeptide (TPR) repeat protein